MGEQVLATYGPMQDLSANLAAGAEQLSAPTARPSPCGNPDLDDAIDALATRLIGCRAYLAGGSSQVSGAVTGVANNFKAADV